MEEQITGRIEDWRLDSESWKGYTVVRGYIYQDIHKRWYEGSTIRTSFITSPIENAKEGALVKTNNSLYLLGKPWLGV